MTAPLRNENGLAPEGAQPGDEAPCRALTIASESRPLSSLDASPLPEWLGVGDVLDAPIVLDDATPAERFRDAEGWDFLYEFGEAA